MAFIKPTKRKDGTTVFWVYDIRDGRHCTIAECHSRPAAELYKEQYEMSKALKSEGYSSCELIADDLFGKREVRHG